MWKQDPVTQRFFEYLKEKRMVLMDSWANGQFTAAFETEMIVKNAAATGACSAYQDMIDIEADQLYGD